jgi:transmembrane sensor
MLTAGQQVTATLDGAIAAPLPMPRGEPAAWRHGRLAYVDAPLRDVVADANRYSREPIVIAGDHIGDLRVSVTYNSDSVEEMLVALGRSFSLRVEHEGSSGLVLSSRDSSDHSQ